MIFNSVSFWFEKFKVAIVFIFFLIHMFRVFENDGGERNYIGEASSRADSKKLNNIDWNGLVENSHTADDLDRSIMDRLQKLKTLSSTKKGLGGKERVDLEEQRGTIGIEKEKSGADTKTRIEGSRKPNSVVKSRQPLLSKRSKKQLKNLGDEERSFSQEDLSGKLGTFCYIPDRLRP